MPPKRMTANPVRPARHRAGKPLAKELSSSDEESESEEEDLKKSSAPAPKATSFPRGTQKITSSLKNVDLNAQRREAAAKEAARLEAERAARAAAEVGFETESEEESGSEGSESGSEEDSSEEESSSEDEAAARRKMLRPVFLKKDQRKASASNVKEKPEEEKQAEDEARRKAMADALVQEHLEKEAAARTAGKKAWDDDEDVADADLVDDRDDLDPEAEFAAWKLRELKRVKREREAIEEAEKEREEIERRRNLTQTEREAEDREFLERQKEERDGRGKMTYMQKYFHKGAFFQDDLAEKGLDKRDIMGSRYADDYSRELLPEYMQIRDMTKLGRKGRTKYKDLKSEDTGRWGVFEDKRSRNEFYSGDDRFRPDRREATGANASAIGERKRGGEDFGRDGKRPRVEDR